MTPDLRTLKSERVELIEKCEQIMERAEARSGRPAKNAAELKEFDAAMNRVDVLSKQISELERRDAANRQTLMNTHQPMAGEQTADERRRAFNAWTRGGLPIKSDERDVALARAAGLDPRESSLIFDLNETRAMGVGVSGGGDKAFPTTFISKLERARKAFGAVREVASVIRTGGGNPLRWPVSNDTGQTGARLAENTQVSAQDIAISEVVLDAYKYSSKLVLVSAELLADEDVDMESFIADALGERLGRIMNTEFTTGTGSSQPNGIVTASTLGKTAAATTVVTYAELVDLQHSVDPAYQPNAKWMFNFSTLAALKKLVDGEGRPLWQPSSDSGMGEFPGTLLGKPYVINQEMPSLTAGSKAILYGDFKKYLVREVKDVTLLRLNERYADYHQTGFLAFMRADGELLNAGTNPVKHLITAAS
jgi:HK97 family phage major capsid protein